MSATAWLLVVDGPHAGETFRLSRTSLIGKGPVEVPLPRDRFVGKRQAVISQGRESWIINDERWASGVLVNGARVRRDHPLREADAITAGRTVLRFTLKEPRVVVDVKRANDWLHVNPAPNGLRHAVSLHGGALATWVRHSVMKELLVDRDGPAFPQLLDLPEGEAATVVEDIMGVSDDELLWATPRDVRVEPQIVLELSLRRLEALEQASQMVAMLTFAGRIVILANRGAWGAPNEQRTLEVRLLETRLGGVRAEVPTLFRPSFAALWRAHDVADVPGMILAVRAMQDLVGGPPSPELVRGVVGNVFAERIAAEELLREEMGLLGVEGLLRMAEQAGV